MDKDVRGIVVVNDHNVNGMLSSHDYPQQTVLRYHALTLLGGAEAKTLNLGNLSARGAEDGSDTVVTRNT